MSQHDAVAVTTRMVEAYVMWARMVERMRSELDEWCGADSSGQRVSEALNEVLIASPGFRAFMPGPDHADFKQALRMLDESAGPWQELAAAIEYAARCWVCDRESSPPAAPCGSEVLEGTVEMVGTYGEWVDMVRDMKHDLIRRNVRDRAALVAGFDAVASWDPSYPPVTPGPTDDRLMKALSVIGEHYEEGTGELALVRLFREGLRPNSPYGYGI